MTLIPSDSNVKADTLEEKGLHEVGVQALRNCTDLRRIIRWNDDHAINLYRRDI